MNLDTLDALGFASYRIHAGEVDPSSVARVAVHNKTNYLLLSQGGALEGILPGKFLKGETRLLPRVGDFVRFDRLAGEDRAVIREVLPRKSFLSRKSLEAGKHTALHKLEEQIIAANVDIVFIVEAAGISCNASRALRYVFMAREGGVVPVVVLNKIDKEAGWEKDKAVLESALAGVVVVPVSAKEGTSLDALRAYITKGVTVVFVGASGVGKSSLANALLGVRLQEVGDVREKDEKGRHTTTKRELIVLPEGGILIDTPGMRELGLWTISDESAEEAFGDLEALSAGCQFRDCDHEKSVGCRIKEELDAGTISHEHYERFLKIRRETELASSREDVVARAQRKGAAKTQKRALRKHLKQKYDR